VQDKFVATLKGGLTLMPRDDTAGAGKQSLQPTAIDIRAGLARSTGPKDSASPKDLASN
jgi:hypothetical protein